MRLLRFISKAKATLRRRKKGSNKQGNIITGERKQFLRLFKSSMMCPNKATCKGIEEINPTNSSEKDYIISKSRVHFK